VTIVTESADRQNSSGDGFRDLFPGFFTPRGDGLSAFFTEGLVVFDTNALFDAYRLNGQARREFLDVLRLLGDRLWIPHQVAEEFLERRLVVLAECGGATEEFNRELASSMSKVVQQLRAFGNRRGLASEDITPLVEQIEEAERQLSGGVRDLYVFDIAADARPEDDPIFTELEQLLTGKIGPAFSEQDRAKHEGEGKRRSDKKIPPGWADAKKDGDRKFGDYLLWEQTLREAQRRELPVLLVSNDEKEDWVQRDHQRRKLGPQPPLVKEVRDRTGQAFHLVNVRSFLVNAKKFLDAEVSESTVEQAEHLIAPFQVVEFPDYRTFVLLEKIREELARSSGGSQPPSASTLENMLALQMTDLFLTHRNKSAGHRAAVDKVIRQYLADDQPVGDGLDRGDRVVGILKDLQSRQPDAAEPTEPDDPP
jgi:hypothetical protein